MQRINGERLKNARLFRGLSLTDLAEATKITKQTLSLYENEAIKPEISKLFILAEALKFPPEYFITQTNFHIKTEATYFRSLMSTSKSERVAQSKRVEFIAQIYGTLIDYVDFPSLRLPNINFSGETAISEEDDLRETIEIENIAKQCRRFWGLGAEPIRNLQKLFEENGLIISSVATDKEKIDAFSQRTIMNNAPIYVIVLNATKNYVRSRFDLAHELGHILLHPWSEDLEGLSRQEFKEREIQANKFAGAFLLPKESFGEDIKHYPTKLEYYVHLKDKWNVSIQAMVYRAHQLQIITTNQYQYLMRQIAKLGWRTNEPNEKPYEADMTLLQEAISLLFAEGGWTATTFIDALKAKGVILRREDVEDLLALAPNSLKDENKKVQLLTIKKY